MRLPRSDITQTFQYIYKHDHDILFDAYYKHKQVCGVFPHLGQLILWQAAILLKAANAN